MASPARPGLHRIPTWLAGVIGIGLVAVAGVAAARGNPVATSPFVRVTAVARRGAASEPLPVPTGPALPEDAGWLGYLIGGLLLLAVVVFVVTLVVLTIRMFSGRHNGLLTRRVLEPEEIDLLTTALPDVDLLGRGTPVAEAVQAGLVDVVSGRDVRAAIIGAWLRLEDAAAVVGTPRQPADAPDDLVQRLLAAHSVGPARLQELAELYRLARFSRAELDERDRAAAVRALSAVRGDLLGEPVAAAGAGTERWPTRWT